MDKEINNLCNYIIKNDLKNKDSFSIYNEWVESEYSSVNTMENALILLNLINQIKKTDTALITAVLH